MRGFGGPDLNVGPEEGEDWGQFVAHLLLRLSGYRIWVERKSFTRIPIVMQRDRERVNGPACAQGNQAACGYCKLAGRKNVSSL